MAKAPKDLIHVERIKIDAGFRRNIKIVRDFSEANRSDVTEMLEEMLFDRAESHEPFQGGRPKGAVAEKTEQILAILKANPNDSAKVLHKKCEEGAKGFDMEFSSFKTRISQLRAEHQIPKLLKKDSKK